MFAKVAQIHSYSKKKKKGKWFPAAKDCVEVALKPIIDFQMTPTILYKCDHGKVGKYWMELASASTSALT